MIGGIAGFIWGLILGIIFTTLELKTFIWQYWVLLIVPIVIFIVTGVLIERRKR